MEKYIINVCLTNLSLYNNGALKYKWLHLPATEDEIEKTLEEIGCGEDAESFISDYECDFMKINEYDNVYYLNELAENVELVSNADWDIFLLLCDEFDDVNKAIAAINFGSYHIWENCDDMGDVARTMCEENGDLDRIDSPLRYHIDWDSYGEELESNSEFIKGNGFMLELY